MRLLLVFIALFALLVASCTSSGACGEPSFDCTKVTATARVTNVRVKDATCTATVGTVEAYEPQAFDGVHFVLYVDCTAPNEHYGIQLGDLRDASMGMQSLANLNVPNASNATLTITQASGSTAPPPALVTADFHRAGTIAVTSSGSSSFSVDFDLAASDFRYESNLACPVPC